MTTSSLESLSNSMIIYWDKETNTKNRIGKRVKELRTERQLSQKALAEQLQLAGYEFNDLTVLRIEQEAQAPESAFAVRRGMRRAAGPDCRAIHCQQNALNVD